MAIKIVSFADNHTKPANLFVTNRLMKLMMGFCAKNNVHHLIGCGDVFETPNISNLPSVSVASSYAAFADPLVTTVTSIGLGTDFVDGNHDKSTGQNLPATSFLERDGINVSHEVGLNVHDYDGQKLAVINIPWLRQAEQKETFGEQKNFVDYLVYIVDEARKYTDNIILNAHINIVGAIENNYTVVDTDFQLSQAELLLLKERGAIAAFMGHIHKRQEFFPHFGYVGAFFQHDFRETNNKAGFDCMEVSDGRVISHTFQAINAPEHVVYTANTLDELKEVVANQDSMFGNSSNRYMLKINTEATQVDFEFKLRYPYVRIQFIQPKSKVSDRTGKSAEEIAEMREVDYIQLYCSEIKKMTGEATKEIIKFYKDTIKEYSDGKTS